MSESCVSSSCSWTRQQAAIAVVLTRRIKINLGKEACCFGLQHRCVARRAYLASRGGVAVEEVVVSVGWVELGKRSRGLGVLSYLLPCVLVTAACLDVSDAQVPVWTES